MRSWLTYIFLLMVACGTVLTSCSDVLSEEGLGTCDDRTTVRLTISFGGNNGTMSRDVDSKDEGLDYTTSGQAEINAEDIYALVVDASGNFLYRIKDLKITANPAEGDNYYTRTLTGTMIQTTQNVRIVLLANLIQNNIVVNNGTELDSKEAVEAYIDGIDAGTAVSTIYNNLVYNYDGTTTPWTLTGDNARRIPMWGQSQETTVPPAQDVTLTCNLYRAVAKVQIWVNEKNGLPGEDGELGTDDDFKITKITVQNANNQGYCVHVAKTQPTTETQYTQPKVPTSVEIQNIFYNVSDEDSNVDTENDAREAYSDMIYLPEQFNTGDDATPVNLLVEYTYNGLEYKGNYAGVIEFKDAEGTAFDVVRNHSYIFNITKSLDFMFVKVEPWEDEYMRGVPDQYTLTTNKSVITYEAYNDKNGQTIDIWTDYSDGWYLEGLNEAESAWLNISANSGEDNLKKTITLTPKTDNNGVTRTASFYVVAGNIKKEITVRQPQPPTANCYVRGNGEYELIVTIKGNGNDGIMPEGADIVPGDGDASITPDKIGIIWETKAGLVKLKDPSGVVYDNTAGTLKLVDYNKTTNSIKYVVNTTGATIGGAVGGNALIGAFNAAGEVIWSWHIWVSPDLIDPETQTVKEAAVEKWTLNDYDVLDRNLGALANRPIESQTGNTKSVASMGLLYQWGRKDPFIGAKYSNDNFTGNGLLDVVHYYEDWNVTRYNNPTTNNLKATIIDETIAHPTKLIYDYTTSGYGYNQTTTYYGMSSLAENGGYLWGTNNGLSTTVKDLGSKTIYDPCPVGYRVPPVDAFVFKATGEVTRWSKGEFVESFTVDAWGSAQKNYGYPVYYSTQTNGGSGDPDEDGSFTVNNYSYSSRTYYVYKAIATTENEVLVSSETDNWRINLIYVPHDVDGMTTTRYQWGDDIDPASTNASIFIYDGDYIDDADYYGFYLNYQKLKEPKLTTTTKNGYYYEPQNNQTITWLPLTGAYDPHKGITFNDVTIEQGSSISVNSFLWTNSSVNNGGNWIPGAMFLHGTENGGSRGSGRHIHDLTDGDIKAEPHYAGAVRCVRDRAKTKWDENYLAPSVSISYGVDMSINIRSVNADWELIDPGQPWLQVTPDKGSATKGQDFPIKLKLLEDVASGSTATLVFKIANETETRSCVVTVQ